MRFVTVLISVGLIFAACSKKSDDEASTKPTLTIKGAAPTAASLAVTTGNASAVNVTVYKVAISTNGDCSSPITVFSSAAGEVKDFATSPTLGSGSVPKGTYNCIMIEMNDILSVIPATSHGTCVAGTAIDTDVCENGIVSTNIDGTTTACARSSTTADRATLYLSTDSLWTSEDEGLRTCRQDHSDDPNYCTNWNAPTATNMNRGFKLAAALVVSADKTSNFIIDTVGKVQSDGAQCGLEAPLFTFE
jgi:hypothetical protein